MSVLIQNSNKKNIILFDVNYYMHRNYHGRPEEVSASGKECHMFNGTINMLRKQIKDLQPDHFMFLFDGKNNFRKVLYPEYKAGRSEKTDAFLEQEEDIFNYLKASGAPVFREDSYEADDLIASVISSLGDEYNYYIASADKDLFQLVSDNVFVLNTKYNKELDRKYEVCGESYAKMKYGVPPNKIGLLLTLMGDSADNLKFINNIGIKTAAKLVNKFNTLAEIITDNEDKIVIKYKEQMVENLDKLYMAEMLIRLFNCKDFTKEDILVNQENKNKDEMEKFTKEKYAQINS